MFRTRMKWKINNAIDTLNKCIDNVQNDVGSTTQAFGEILALNLDHDDSVFMNRQIEILSELYSFISSFIAKAKFNEMKLQVLKKEI